MQLSEFQGCEETIAFLRLINQLFNILNSRNPLGKGYKAALTQKNENYWHHFLADAVTYLSKVTNTDGKPLHSTQRKTPFIGFIIAIVSVEGIFEYLIVQKKWLKYLLTYKLSQNSLELFSAQFVHVEGGIIIQLLCSLLQLIVAFLLGIMLKVAMVTLQCKIIRPFYMLHEIALNHLIKTWTWTFLMFRHNDIAPI